MFELALLLWRNKAACSLKLIKFKRGSKLCSLVLKYDHNNVKALFRRAVVELELKHPKVAFKVLLKAAGLDPLAIRR